jgi:hypothetical protein
MARTRTSPSTNPVTTANKSAFDFALLGLMVDAQLDALVYEAKDAAREAGVDASKVSTVRKGRAVSLNNVCKLCTWLQLPLDFFVVRELTTAAQRRFDRLVELHASPADVERRREALLAAAKVR